MMTQTHTVHVLIVQDGSGSAPAAARVLISAGVQVRIAGSGSEALEMLAQASPHVLIMDLARPERDGWDILVAMRSNPATAHIPVATINTAYASDPERAASFDGCLPSPAQGDEFLREVIALAAS